MISRPVIAGLLGVFLGASTADAKVPGNPGGDDDSVYMYSVDASHSSIAFKVRHLGLASVTGAFRSYEVQLAMNPGDLKTLSAETVIDVQSIDTGIEKRDNHLRSADFFDVETFPTIRFVSKEVRNVVGTDFELVGELTIRDITREIVLSGQLVGTAEGPGGETRVGMEASAEISRKEFGLTWNNLTEAGGIIVGDEVKLVLEVQAIQS
jgi:polyisoprenoid-binding protein YceI